MLQTNNKGLSTFSTDRSAPCMLLSRLKSLNKATFYLRSGLGARDAGELRLDSTGSGATGHSLQQRFRAPTAIHYFGVVSPPLSCISTLHQFSRDTMKLFCVSLVLCLGLMTSVSGQGGFFSNFINTANRFNPFNNRRPPSRPSFSRPSQPSAPTFTRPSSSSFSQPRPSSGSVINEIPSPSLGQQQTRPSTGGSGNHQWRGGDYLLSWR